MSEETKKVSSLEVKDKLTPIKKDQLTVGTWPIIIFLVVFGVILKMFIFTKDEKRHGK